MLSRRLAQGAVLVVDDKLSAAQLEAYLARETGLADAGGWRSPDIRTYDDWCATLWRASFDRERLLLDSAQTDALWRRVVAESPAGAALIDTGRIAAWARQAWSLLQAWRLDYRELRARDDDPGFRDFLEWAARFDAELADSGWLDKAMLAGLVAENLKPDGQIPASVVRADARDETPASRALLGALAQAGSETDSWAPVPVSRFVHRVGLETAAHELRHAVAWAQRKIEDSPRFRVALVVPPGVENELGLARCFEQNAGSPAYRLADGHPVDREPAIGAALDSLRLFGRHADFPVFSRWLRSPFVGADMESLAVRGLAEAELRGELVAQLGFVTAYRSAGLDRSLRRRAPLLCEALDGVFRRLDRASRYQSPTRWAGLAQEVLNDLGWPGPAALHGPALDAWRKALESLSGLTPVLGTIDYERALVELRNAVARARLPSHVAFDGITVLSRLEDLGPGYDAAWVMGMSDRVWPRPADPNPLLPQSLQRVQQMPFATPADAVQRCRALTDRVIARVPEIVFSYPLIENDFAAAASPLLREVDEIGPGSLPALDVVYAPSATGVAMEEAEDPVPPFSGTLIAGGAGTLATQAQCPLRAFIDSRLAARPLERPERGFGARQRGILVHRALELLFSALPGQQLLAGLSDEALTAKIRECVDRAIAERVRGAGRSLRVYASLERDRLIPLIRELVGLDLTRVGFVAESLELKLTARIGGFDVACRIDRIDRLADGSLAIIDYKTGSTATPADWFRSRLVEPQLPLYLHVIDTEVSAIVIGRVHPSAVVYRGLWQESGTFPGPPYRPRTPLEWPAQKARWSAQLEALIAEYAGGDGRIFVMDSTLAEGFYAPLTRVYDALSLVACGPAGPDT